MGPCSASLRVWSPANKSDVYIGARERAGDFKISLHGSGMCLAGLTAQLAAKEITAMTALHGVRTQSRWMRVTHAGSRFVTPLQFAFPNSELRTWRDAPLRDPTLTWIDAPGEGRSVIVTCGFSGQVVENDQWPGKANGTHLLGSKILPNGEKFWLLWQNCATTPDELTMLSEASALLSRPGMIYFSGVTWETPLAPRTMIFKEYRADRLLIVLDAATG
jgi:hypothetical protein